MIRNYGHPVAMRASGGAAPLVRRGTGAIHPIADDVINA